ncbi:MAG: prolyl-tRNA synthetase associated domain-containing protein [Clostridia bacterium]|nr:prolyl-tRNA synthetase associated domain-containing protein [Clostridia bacterium]
MDENESRAISELEAHGISCIRITHEPAVTMELCMGIGEEYGARHVKNLFLTNRSETRFCLLLMSAEKEFRTSAVSKAIGVSRLSFASEEKLNVVMGLVGGAVSVMGIVNDCARKAYSEGKLSVVFDADVLKREMICVHPNVPTSTLVLKTSDLVRFLEEKGVAYKVINI